MHFVYIIYSDKWDQFYVGESENVETRVDQHNSGFFQHGFTSKANDWQIFICISCANRIQARKIENHIKRMKSKQYIRNLKKYPEMQTKLLNTYK
ncbi:GIY-YIG nuclease family protein [Flavobacteriaceae bacterium D16]|nr:GIY-YIG nuclease family protein [Flavobacteriaceae bacterium D16]